MNFVIALNKRFGDSTQCFGRGFWTKKIEVNEREVSVTGCVAHSAKLREILMFLIVFGNPWDKARRRFHCRGT